jgi:FAD/FMN-containing dehydrogenase
VDAVSLARALNLEVAVRGGGHNVAGRSTVDGGVMIDLSPMRAVHVDRTARTARVQGGATWAEFNREAQLYGLATTGGVVSTTGVAGLTLGGGLGWLMGKHGLAIDNLRSVELVTADGRVRHASASNDPDLFWAVRGGGGNFGIAASFEFGLHLVGPTVTGGVVFWPFAAAADVLRLFRELAASDSDDLGLAASVVGAPDGSGLKTGSIACCHAGAPRDGEAVAGRINALGTPVTGTVGPMTYCDVNRMLDDGYPKGARNYWKSQFMPELTDAAIRTMVECFESCPSPMSEIYLEHLHGAAVRVGPGETAYPLRAPGYNIVIVAQWTGPADDERCIKWARESYAAMRPFMGRARYVNYLDHDDPGDAVAAAYGANYARLQALKARYDPDNFFHLNQNIRPAG